MAVEKCQSVAITGKASLNAMLATKPPKRSMHFSGVSPHDWQSAMGENGPVNSSLFAPAELGNDRGVADQPAISFAHHRAPNGRPIPNIDVDPPKNVRSIGERRHVWQIEETSVLCRHAISNGWRSNRMLDWDRRERGSVDRYRFFQPFGVDREWESDGSEPHVSPLA